MSDDAARAGASFRGDVRAGSSPLSIAQWRRGYQGKWLLPDGIAGLTVWALLVPEAMAYASVAGVPVQFGLYSVPLAVLGYALFGGSRELFVGPSSTVAVLAASTVAPLAASGSDDYIALIATLSILVGVLAIGIRLSLGLFVHRLDHPHTAVVGRLPDGTFADTTLNANARTIDGVLIYRLDAPLMFANADVVVEDLQTRASNLHRIVLDMEAVYEIDTQGADALARLARDLSEKGVAVVLARPHAPVRELLERLHVTEALGPDSVFATVEEAVGYSTP